MLTDVAAVVVHFRSYDTVGRTVQSLLDDGLAPDNVVVVDNSEEPAQRAALEESIPDGVPVRYEVNRGYGAAVNVGIEHFQARLDTPQFFLVATHETVILPGSLEALREALLSRPAAAVAGPTLISGSPEHFVWSTGGFFTSRLKLPSHYDHRRDVADIDSTALPLARDWLDGAFLLYRWADISRTRVSEDFFVYMEETDLHLRLRSLGREAVWVPAAQVWQSSGGVPPYYFARNLRLLAKRHHSAGQRLLTVAGGVGRRILADVRHARIAHSIGPLLRGLTARLPEEPRPSSPQSVAIVNPLGGALARYTDELEDVLQSANVHTRRFSEDEPSVSGRGRIAWLRAHARNVSAARRATRSLPNSRVLIVWPALGYADLLLARLLGGPRVSVVLHDPRPLVAAAGYSKGWLVAASQLAKQVEIIAHSTQAASIIEHDVPGLKLTILPHPIGVPRESSLNRTAAVRVVGQYKSDRNVTALAEVSTQLADEYSLEIFGRRWPNVEGWTVSPVFVSEDTLDELVASSTAVLIPYKRFFQSGIAIRCLEAGTPFIGPRSSSLEDILGRSSKLLVDTDSPSDWIRAIRYASSTEGKQEAVSAAARWRSRALERWASWAN